VVQEFVELEKQCHMINPSYSMLYTPSVPFYLLSPSSNMN
jgi:hypothetical protein